MKTEYFLVFLKRPKMTCGTTPREDLESTSGLENKTEFKSLNAT